MSASGPSPRAVGNRDDAAALMDLLQRYVVAFEENLRHLGSWLGVPATDAMAFATIIWADSMREPMTPSRLSQRMGMSSGSTTALIDRLERAGHVTRSRESSDRRVVTVRSQESSRERVEQFFADSGRELSELLGNYDAGVLNASARVMEAVLRHLEQDNDRRGAATE